jgi:tRNA(Ile)-lysidine synthase
MVDHSFAESASPRKVTDSCIIQYLHTFTHRRRGGGFSFRWREGECSLFLKRLKQEIEQRRSLPFGAKLLLGVSGGADSMALLHGLLQFKAEYAWRFYVIHVNHQLRGEESEEDARYVQNYCKEQQIPCVTERVESEIGWQTGGNKQAIARDLRYQAFQKAVYLWNVDCLVLAHHADDQMETILMHLIRGAGVSSLSGIEPERAWNGVKLVRPILAIGRVEIEAYCHEHRLNPRTDRSNYALTYTRNRIRHQLIPQLAALNPRVREAFLQLADLVREEERVWEAAVDESLLQVVKERTSEHIILRVPHFLSLVVALQRRVIKRIWDFLSRAGRGEATFAAVEQVRWLISQHHPSLSIDLPGGLMVKRRYEECIFQRRRPLQVRLSDPSSWQIIPIFIPGMTSIPDFKGKIEVIVSSVPIPHLQPCLDWAVFDGDLLCEPVFVRRRHPGDVMRCLGMKGRKKLKNLFIEMKIPKEQRNFYPVFIVEEQILWIPGVRRSNLAIITSFTKRYLYFLWHVI